MHSDHLIEEVTRAARSIPVSEDIDSVLDSIVTSAVDSLPGIQHAGITVAGSDGRLETLARTDDFVTRLDELHNRLGEGPCVFAIESEPVVVVNHLRHEQRWPRFVPPALELGLRSQLGLRLYVEHDRMGGLNLYSTDEDEIDPDVQHLAELFAAHAALAMGYVRQTEHLNRALASRARIGQAMGILMERYSLDEDQAFGYLRRISSDNNVKLRDVADGLVRLATEDSEGRSGRTRAPAGDDHGLRT